MDMHRQARPEDHQPGVRSSSVHSRSAYRWMWITSALVALVLVIGACSLPGGQTSTGDLGNSNTTAATSPTTTTSGTASATDTPNPGSGTAVPTTAGQPTPFAVNGVTMSASPANFSGACSSTMTFTFTANILAPAGTSGGTVKYRWYRSDGSSSSTDQTVTFAAGDTSKTVTDTWTLGAVWGNGTTFWEKVKTSAPNVWYSPQGNFHFTCQFGVAGAAISVSPTSYNCLQSSETFTFSGSITLHPAPGTNSVTYHWARTDGATGSDTTANVAAGASSIPVSTTWTITSGTSIGDYGEKVVITKVNGTTLGSAVTSNTPTFHKPGCF